MNFVHIGFGNYANLERVIALLNPQSAGAKRVVWKAEEKGKLVDLTGKKKTRAVLFCDSNDVILSALNTETIAERIKKEG